MMKYTHNIEKPSVLCIQIFILGLYNFLNWFNLSKFFDLSRKTQFRAINDPNWCGTPCIQTSSRMSFSVLFCPGLLSFPGQFCPVPFCPVQSCPVQSCPVQSCPVLSCPVLSCPLQSYPIMFNPILSYLTLSFRILSCLIISCPIMSCPILFNSVLSYTVLCYRTFARLLD